MVAHGLSPSCPHRPPPHPWKWKQQGIETLLIRDDFPFRPQTQYKCVNACARARVCMFVCSGVLQVLDRFSQASSQQWHGFLLSEMFQL